MTRFYANELEVKMVAEGADDDAIVVAEASQWIAGAAEQIARALNRLPEAEALLIKVARTIRHGKIAASYQGGRPADTDALADEIEEWMVNG